MANAIIARGVAAFVQRWKIVVKKAQGPTGDNYLKKKGKFVELIEDEAEAETMRALYDRYRPTFFSAPVVGEHQDDAPAPRRGPATIDDDAIVF